MILGIANAVRPERLETRSFQLLVCAFLSDTRYYRPMADLQQADGRCGTIRYLPPQISVTRRLVYAIALIPIVPATAAIGTILCSRHIPFSSFDEQRWFHLFFSILWVGLSVVVWRSLVIWTLGRVWLTALVSMVPFIQVVLAQPIWIMPSSGCIDFSNELKRFGQHELGIGAWVWLIVWVWWGWERYTMKRTKQESSSRGGTLPGHARRAIMSIGSLPVVVGLIPIGGELLDDFTPLSNRPALGATLCAFVGIVAVVIWLLIWRRAVCWSRLVWFRTLLFAAPLILIPALLIYWSEALPSATEEYVFALPFLAWGSWMTATIRFWPMRYCAGASGEFVPTCIACSYPLTGLCATRCPECGDERTIDELWRANAGEIP